MSHPSLQRHLHANRPLRSIQRNHVDQKEQQHDPTQLCTREQGHTCS